MSEPHTSPQGSSHGGLGKLALAGVLSLLVLATLFVAPASAGRLVATGHDVDDHCSETIRPGGAVDDAGQCGFMQVATDYVRGGAPDPAKPVLAFDCSGVVVNALDGAYGTGTVPRVQSCPSANAGAFNALEMTTGQFSAIIVGSSCDDHDSDGYGKNAINLTDGYDDGQPEDAFECDQTGGSTPDSDLINSRKDDIAAFFNDGGGIFAMSGDRNGDGDPTSGPDVYYDFLPLDAQGVEVTPPFCLTDVGIGIGFQDQLCPDLSLRSGTRDDINCCPTHNSFAEPPAGGVLKVAERDDEGFAETLVAEGLIGDGGFIEKPAPDPEPEIDELPANDAALFCGKRELAIQDVVRVGKDRGRARVDGLARSSLIGTGAQIRGKLQKARKGKRGRNAAKPKQLSLGATTIREDGSFRKVVKLPAKRSQIKRLRLIARAVATGSTSRAVKLTRRARLTKVRSEAGQTTLRGKLYAPRSKNLPKVIIERRVACKGKKQWQKVAASKQKPNRTFEATFANPEGAVASIFRARTRYTDKKGVKAKLKTATPAVAVTLG